MSDHLDLDNKPDEDEFKFSPAGNPGTSDYDKKFNKITSSRDNQAFDDQVDAGNADGFAYSHDPDRREIAQQEGVGDSLYNPSKELEKANDAAGEKGAISKRLGKTSSRLKGFASGGLKNKILLGAIGAGGGGAILLLIPILFMLISGFGVGQVAEISNIANFSRLHLATYRRTSQYVTEKALNPDAEGYKINTQGKTILDRFTRFDPNKALGNLREEGNLEFITKDGEKRSLSRLGLKVDTSELKYVKLGDIYTEVPKASNWNLVANYRNQKEFIQNLELAVDQSDLFAESSRLYRTKIVNSIIDASDIKLFRWLDKGRKIRTFKDAILSGYDRFKPAEKATVTNPDLSDADTELDNALKGIDADTVGSAPQLVASAEEKVAQKLAKNPAKSFAGQFSIAVITINLYCSSRDYINSLDTNARNRVTQYKQAGAMTQSAYDQIKSGDTTASAVVMEAKRIDGFSQSKRYQESVGNPDAASMPNDIDKSASPVKQTGGSLYNILNGIKIAGDASLLGAPLLFPGGADAVCKGLSSTIGNVAMAVVENAITAVLAAGTGGGAGVAKETAEEGATATLKEIFKAGLSNLGKDEVKKFGVGTGKDVLIFLTVDMVLKNVLGNSGNPAGDDGQALYAKQDIGTKLLANDTANAMGGRPLSGGELADLNNRVKEQKFAILHKQSLYTRIASLANPLSPTSQAVATLPYSFGSLKTKSVAFAETSLNPIQTISANTTRFASAALGTNKIMGDAYASADSDQADFGVPTIGYSVSELDKMLEPDFWPLANEQYVKDHAGEFDDIKDCFKPMTKSATSTCDSSKLSSDSALHYRLYQLDGGNASDSGGSSDYNDGLLGSIMDTQEVTNSSGSPSSTTPSNSNIYILGDSYTVGLQNVGMEQKLKDAGFNPTVEAACGRPLAAAPSTSRCGGSPAGYGGLTELDQPGSKSAIQSAGTVVLALGTNDAHGGSPDTFGNNVSQAIAKVKALNPAAKIFWVNLYDKQDPDNTIAFDTKLSSLSGSLGFTIIDWATTGKQAGFGAGGLHPTDYGPLMNLILQAIGSPSGPISMQTKKSALNQYASLLGSVDVAQSITLPRTLNTLEGIS